MRAFFFDLDGTLTDSRAGIVDSYRAALGALGVAGASDRDLEAHLGAPLPVMFKAFRPGLDATAIDAGIAAYRAAYERDGIFKNELYPGARGLLERLHAAGHAAWIVTAKPAPYARQVADMLGIRGLVAGLVGASLAETDTKAGLIAQALCAAGAAPGETLMLGDRHYDVTGAIDNGVMPVGALWGYGARAELTAAGCRAFAASPADFARRYAG